MTAAKESDGAPNSPADDRPTALHTISAAEGGSYDIKPSGLFDFDGDRCSGGGDLADLASAKTRFVSAIKSSVDELMSSHGYSREKATALLLRGVRGDDDSSPKEEDIFVVMENLGVGLGEAETTLTVARALRRIRSERAVTAVDAIQDLTSQLCLTKLLGEATKTSSAPPPKKKSLESDPVPVTSGATVTPIDRTGTTAKNITSGAIKWDDDTSFKSASSQPHRSSTQAHTQRKTRATRSTRQKSPRKRAFASNDEMLSSRPDALPRKEDNAVDGDDVDAQVAKKAKISEEAGIASAERSKSPAAPAVAVRTKRGVAHRGEDQLQAAQVVKRTRADSDLQA